MTYTCKGESARRIDKICREHHFTRSELAAELGMTRSAVTQKFTGKTRFTLKDMSVIADLFDVSLDYLTGRTDTKQPMEVTK